MKQPATNIVMQYLHTLTAVEAEVSDADLLRRYATQHDGDAFALLVRRHGPMVLGVCRRVLGPTPDADDAFQATFLALAKQAGRVRDCLGGWLQRVAVRAAQRALRRQQATPLTHDVADTADPFANTEWRDVRALLDTELAKLPDELRTPLVLCYLDGLTRDEAAQRLGWSLRTLHRRLDEGRQRLQRRLSKRGIAPVLLAAFIAGDELRAAVAPTLVRQAASFGIHATATPAVLHLVPTAARGGIMKATLLAFVSTLGLLGFGLLTKADAQTALRPTPPPLTEFVVPRPKERDPFVEAVNKAKTDVIAYLKKSQNASGSWEDEKGPLANIIVGGQSCLVVLALLEAGIAADEEWLQNGLKYIRTLKPTYVYVTALQTQVLCKANQKEDAERIKANVTWLEKGVVRNGGKLEGWTYNEKGGRSDGSNSRYAIAALYTAHKVGFKVESKDFWTEVAARYMGTQSEAGAWGYVSPMQPTATMTMSGTLCLHLAYDVIGEQTKESKEATERGRTWIEDRLKFDTNTTPYYHIDVLADMGRAVHRRKLTDRERSLDWYREGGAWLFKQQKVDGRFQGTTAENANVASAFALRFLSSQVD